ncbi:MAG: hypothetical protein F6J90_01080 [Moorea sp. SIOASIH]|uniref:Hint domain-containing protein n=1 Tax=Moorena sp. SIOASIH TaxID=2607817 RepID=UPI0013BC66A0|nr:Hint domain-containing protein [Moorena sp. SIOASIH]NEO34970.1 hypothetical protein [Moorena sp. SIOASIH]
MTTCIEAVKGAYGQNAKEILQVDWKNIPEDDLESDSFKSNAPFPLVCPQQHCQDHADISPIAHSRCRCIDANKKPIPNCNPKNYLQPYPSVICVNVDNPSESKPYRGRKCIKQGDSWYPLSCSCCCSCFAFNTKIAVPSGGFKFIQDFSVGNKVLTADLESQDNGIKLKWLTAKVSFSQGTGPDSHQSAMVYIHHGNDRSIIVTPDHLFLLPSGKLKRAEYLVPGKDQLVSDQGEPVPIHEVSIGEYEGGVHHIATNKEFTGDISGHLLLSEGVVSGDFNLQIHADQLKEKDLIVNHDDLPKIGTSAYEKANTELATGHYAFFKSQATPAVLPVESEATQSQAIPVTATEPQKTVTSLQKRKFYVHGTRVASIPETTAKFISSPQALDVSDNADRYSFSEVPTVNSMVKYILRLYGVFYQDIVFYHDIGRLEPNAYAFTQYGRKIVVVSGGLTRIKGLLQEGLSVIVSHLVTRLHKIEPHDYNGYTSVGMADYYMLSTLGELYYGATANQVFAKGLKQIEKTIFHNITPRNSRYESDPYSPSIETRLDAMDAAYAADFPPPGIGGPTLGGLQLTDATASPPQLQPSSFITYDIDIQMAQEVVRQLQEHQILDTQGVLHASFNLDRDLSFLFAGQPENQRKLLLEQVRYVLLHAGASILVSFNIDVDPQTAMDEDDYELEPAAKVFTAQVSQDDPSVVVLSAQIERNVEYTLTVAQHVKAANGSTLDLETNTTKFRLV